MTTRNQDTAVAAKQKTVSITRTFNAPVEEVWKAWSEPESFKKWWGPKDFTCPDCTIDFKVGGQIFASMQGPDGKKIWSTCAFSKIEPMKKIIYMDNFADEKGNKVPASYYNMSGDWSNEVQVTVTFEDVNGKTKMTMDQTNIPEDMYDDCITGWQQCFDKMENSLK
jgi:uncharacterized protein YndB with AHSA1/START domain